MVAFGAIASARAEGNSGFLDDYSQLQPDPDRPGAQRYEAPGVDLGKYTKILVTPIELVYDANSPHKNISPDELKMITDAFYTTLVAQLEPAYPVVDQPGPDVLAVRLAITGVRMENKKRSLLGYTPIGFATTTVANAAGLRVTLKSAGLEAELLDSVSGTLLGSLVDKGAATAKISGNTSWDELSNTLKFYAERFRSRWDTARAR
jgi:hypothetical protein